MFLKDFLYFLTDKSGKSYRVTGNTVSTTGTPTPLPTTPDGWQEKSVKWGRSTKYHGMIRTFTTPLKFVKEGARIIRELFYMTGFEAGLYLVISRLDKTFGAGWVHKLFFYGELDLSKTQDEQDTVTVNIMSGGLDKLIKANENTTYEIPITDPRAVIIEHDGITLRTKGNYQLPTGLEIRKSLAELYAAPITFINEEGRVPGVVMGSQMYEQIGANLFTWLADTNNVNHFMQASITNQTTLNVRLQGALNYTGVQNDIGASLWFRFLKDTTTPATQADYQIVTSAGCDPGVSYSYPFDITVPLEPGEKLFLCHFFFGAYAPGAIDAAFEYADTTISASVENRFQTTHVMGFRPIDLGQILVEKMCGPGYTFQSDYLENDWNGLLITSGDALRGFADAKIKTSWNDFFKSYNAVLNLEQSISNNTIIIEPKENAYLPTVSAALGEVTDISIQVAEDYAYNTVKVGYPNSQIEDANGREEFNVTQQYSSAVTRVVKELDLVSSYSASMIDIEYTRINFDGKETTNSSTDNTVFFILCNNTAVLDGSGLFMKYQIRRDTYDELNGLTFPATAYNIEISPKHNLMRHGNFLKGVFYFQISSGLTFQTSDKNAALETVNYATMISSEARVKESSNLNLSLIPDNPLFIPLQAKFTCPSPVDLWDIMESGSLGTFTFVWDSNTYSGYVLEVSVQPADNAPQETRLLLSYNNNLTTLIR